MPTSDVPARSETLTWIDQPSPELTPAEALVPDQRWATYFAIRQARAERTADDSATCVLGGQNATTGQWQAADAARAGLFTGLGSPDWTEHVADDASAAAEFYASVFETAAASERRLSRHHALTGTPGQRRPDGGPPSRRWTVPAW